MLLVQNFVDHMGFGGDSGRNVVGDFGKNFERNFVGDFGRNSDYFDIVGKDCRVLD